MSLNGAFHRILPVRFFCASDKGLLMAIINDPPP